MRVTDNMSSEASMKTGISLTGNTLASHLSGDPADSLVNSLGNKGSSTLKSLSADKYKRLREAAEDLERQAERLRKTDGDSVFRKAEESGDKDDVCRLISDMVSSYNEVLSRLRTDTSTLSRFYRQSLVETAAEYKDALAEAGITADKNGNLTVDREKLKEADLKKLEKLFGSDGILTEKLTFIAEKVADNADANIKSISGSYNAAGSSIDTLIRSFDSKG